MFLYIITDDICQYWKNLDKMILSSPNFPKWYNIPPSPSCDWLISAQEGFIIALEFNHFHVSKIIIKYICCNLLQHFFICQLNEVTGGEFVSLYDGICDQTKELKKLTGTMPNDDKWVISSRRHHMFVSFIYGIGHTSGFQAKIHYGTS